MQLARVRGNLEFKPSYSGLRIYIAFLETILKTQFSGFYQTAQVILYTGYNFLK